MENIIYTVNLDFTDNGCVDTGWRLKQGDYGNSKIVVKLSNNGDTFYDGNISPQITFKRADGNSVVAWMTADASYQGYTYIIVGNELEIPGSVIMDLKVIDSEDRTSTASCKFFCVANPEGYDPEGTHTYVNSDLIANIAEDAEAALMAKEDARTYATMASTAAGEAATSRNTAVTKASEASTSATASSNSKLDAEGWAVGEQNGTPVPSTSPYYHNNAKYYSSLLSGTINEVQNARIGADGVAYNTLGEAIRTNDTIIKNTFDNVSIVERFAKTLLINDGYLAKNGNINAQGTTGGVWLYSDTISLNSEIFPLYMHVKAFGVNSSGTIVANVAFYDDAGRCISSVYISTSTSGDTYEADVEIPMWAKTMRICNHSNQDFEAYSYKYVNNIMIDDLGIYQDKIVVNAFKYVSSQNGYINTNGAFIGSPNNGWYTSSIIDVTNYNHVRYKLQGMNAACVLVTYNMVGNVIDKIIPPNSSYSVMSGDLDISSAKTMRICCYNNANSYVEQKCMLYGFGAKNDSIISHVVNRPYTFANKNAVFCGDSITAGFTSGSTITQNGFPKLFSDAVGMTFINKGVGGATITRITGYGCIKDQVSSIDLSSADYIFIAGGVNDWQLAASLSEFRSSVKNICDYLVEHNYNGSVIFILPISEAGRIPIETPIAELDDYRVIIAEVAMQYEHSVVNGKLFNFPTVDSDSAFITAMFGDRLHPTEKGYRLYAKNLKNVLC